MCLILVAWQAHPAYLLVVAANRDEFFIRPTAAAGFWPGSDILAGRDLKEGGTWMGLTRSGRFAALTNYRDPALHVEGRASRGDLVVEFLHSGASPADWLHDLATRRGNYNGFNLLAGDLNSLACLESTTGAVHVLKPGVYGLSNHLLDSPWPKVTAAKSDLADALAGLPDDRPLFDLLRDDSPHPDHLLPRTGIGLEWERLLSSAFVKAPGYGTRSSSVLKVSRGDTPGEHIVTTFDEQTWLEGDNPGNRSRYRFNVDPGI
jgi:uncharacterized protein with NRDE domain